MFRKLQDRIAAAASAAFGSTEGGDRSETDLQRLLALGPFTTEQAASALTATSGNVDDAAELLLTQMYSSSSSLTSSYDQQQQQQQQQQQALQASEDVELQRALQQSLQDSTSTSTSARMRTPVMNAAAQAAQQRAKGKPKKAPARRTPASDQRKEASSNVPVHSIHNASDMRSQSTLALPVPLPLPILRNNVHKLKQHHPDVKLIPKLQDKSLEEQILRTADRMKHHPAAVDTLYRAVTALFRDPDNAKFRQIDTHQAAFLRSVAPAPGALDFLKALRFTTEGQGRFLILYPPLYDPALVYLGATALEQTRETTEYQTAKVLLVFAKELTQLLQTAPTAAESARRAAYLAKCPTEPSAGQGALLQVHLLLDQSSSLPGGGSGATAGAATGSATIHTGRTIRRRFDSDDTIADVLAWIAGSVGTDILDRLTSGTWCLVNVNHSQRAPIHITTQQHWTLQSVGCWPSGRLLVQPSSLHTPTTSTEAKLTDTLRSWVLNQGGDSHGLASGTSSDDE